MAMRKSTIYCIFILANLVFLSFLLCFYPLTTADYFKAAIAKQKQLVGNLQLTDLCLFTEAGYTRNLSLADLHAPFQDYPMAFEHFPSGSITTPPFDTLGSRK